MRDDKMLKWMMKARSRAFRLGRLLFLDAPENIIETEFASLGEAIDEWRKVSGHDFKQILADREEWKKKADTPLTDDELREIGMNDEDIFHYRRAEK